MEKTKQNQSAVHGEPIKDATKREKLNMEEQMRDKYLSTRQRYNSDPVFSKLVDMMIGQLEQVYHIECADFKPSEVREAAILALILYEERYTKEIAD